MHYAAKILQCEYRHSNREGTWSPLGGHLRVSLLLPLGTTADVRATDKQDQDVL